jgi:hypothetical protein
MKPAKIKGEVCPWHGPKYLSARKALSLGSTSHCGISATKSSAICGKPWAGNAGLAVHRAYTAPGGTAQPPHASPGAARPRFPHLARHRRRSAHHHTQRRDHQAVPGRPKSRELGGRFRKGDRVTSPPTGQGALLTPAPVSQADTAFRAASPKHNEVPHGNRGWYRPRSDPAAPGISAASSFRSFVTADPAGDAVDAATSDAGGADDRISCG